jgi:hypothetical protein
LIAIDVGVCLLEGRGLVTGSAVALYGSADRRGWVAGFWLVPVVRFAGGAGSGGVSLTVQKQMAAYGRSMERGANERRQARAHGNELRWGDRMHGGAVTGGARDGRVWVNVTVLGTGLTAWLGPEEADDLAGQLRLWAEQVRRTRRG